MSNQMTNSTKVVEFMEKHGGIDAKRAYLYLNMSGETLWKTIRELCSDENFHRYIEVRSGFYFFDGSTK